MQAVPLPTSGTPSAWGIFAAGAGIGVGGASAGLAWAVRMFRGLGPEREYRSSSVEAMGQVTNAIRDLSQNSQRESAAVTSALQSTALALVKITERLEHIPTKLDLVEESKEIRHDARGAIGAIGSGIQDQLIDLRTAVAELPGDTAAAIYNREGK